MPGMSGSAREGCQVPKRLQDTRRRLQVDRGEPRVPRVGARGGGRVAEECRVTGEGAGRQRRGEEGEGRVAGAGSLRGASQRGREREARYRHSSSRDLGAIKDPGTMKAFGRCYNIFGSPLSWKQYPPAS